MSSPATAACGWCGTYNPEEALQCTGCGSPFGPIFEPSDGSDTRPKDPTLKTVNLAEGDWVQLTSPAKVGPLTLYASGLAISSGGHEFAVDRSIDDTTVDNYTLSVKDGHIAIRSEEGEVWVLRFSDKTWYSQHETQPFNRPSPQPSSKVAFAGVPWLHTRFTPDSAAHYAAAVMIPRQDRSISDYASHLVSSIRNANIPVLIAWNASATDGLHRFELLCRCRYMGSCWVTSAIRCFIRGDDFVVDMFTTGSDWFESKPELKRIRKAYGQLLMRWLVFATIYLVVVSAISMFTKLDSVSAFVSQSLGVNSSTTEHLGNVLRFLVGIGAYWLMACDVAFRRSKIHFPYNPARGTSLKEAILSSSSFHSLLMVPFLIVSFFYVCVQLPELPRHLNTHQQVPGILAFLGQFPPEFVLIIPKSIRLLWQVLCGDSVRPPRLIPFHPRWLFLPRSVVELVISIRSVGLICNNELHSIPRFKPDTVNTQSIHDPIAQIIVASR